MKKDTYIYPVIFDYADDGISIEFPDLPGCLTCADTDEEALDMAADAMRGWILVSEESSGKLPEPTPLTNVPLESNQRAIMIEACLAIYRDAHKTNAIDETLTVPA